MINLKDGETFALLLRYQNKNGEEEANVFSGVLETRNNAVFLIDPDTKKEKIQIFEEWQQSIKPVPSELSLILNNCKWYVSLLLQDLPESYDEQGLLDTNLKWIADEN